MHDAPTYHESFIFWVSHLDLLQIEAVAERKVLHLQDGTPVFGNLSCLGQPGSNPAQTRTEKVQEDLTYLGFDRIL